MIKRKPQRILIIEDDCFFQILCKYYLGLLGYHLVDIVTSAEEALTKTLSDYALIITDFQLGEGLNGAQFAQAAAKKTTKTLPILIMSAGSDEAIYHALLNNSAQAFLAKPFQFNEFKTTIQNLMKSRIKYAEHLAQTASKHKIKFIYHRFVKGALQQAIKENFPQTKLPQKALVFGAHLLKQQLVSVTLEQQGFDVKCLSEISQLEQMMSQVDLILIIADFKTSLTQTLVTLLQTYKQAYKKPKLFLLAAETQTISARVKFDAVFKLTCLAV